MAKAKSENEKKPALLTVDDILELIQRTSIEIALRAADFNISKAAAAMGMNRTTLSQRARQHGIEFPLEEVPTKKPAPEIRAAESAERLPPRGLPFSWRLYKQKLVLDALALHEGNRTKAAQEIGISLRGIRIFIRDLKAQGVDVPENTIRIGFKHHHLKMRKERLLRHRVIAERLLKIAVEQKKTKKEQLTASEIIQLSTRRLKRGVILHFMRTYGVKHAYRKGYILDEIIETCREILKNENS